MSAREVLMLIDMQAVFARPPSPWASGQYPGAERHALRLRAAYPDERTAITRYLPPDPVTGAWVPYFEAWPFALDPAQADYELMPGFEPRGATLIERTTFGKWDATSQHAMGDPDAIVLAGVSTDCCVLSTALAAADAGVRVRVVADACAGASPTDHQRALDAMALYAPLIEITDTDAVLRGSLPA
ncbi:nicotinamidase-related amidase [Branchiibius hedensis]|uniref:Nicotinamidase-related amidase n=1 Tax=Branchiibius hedensis TaxID=672460 RepID=A0A2Y8ZRU9_9MICO|nr:cysteine hydrolase [Branchiibius hedensis]PWJ26298.1 nicotinamidase-related amidase [Branchiibius hedensis]SSA35110.1 Nicotinamidase-related amidase [Branchiibius hedensis]